MLNSFEFIQGKSLSATRLKAIVAKMAKNATCTRVRLDWVQPWGGGYLACAANGHAVRLVDDVVFGLRDDQLAALLLGADTSL